jgi:predicted Zn-dependent protease
MKSLRVLLFAVVVAGCATNPATGRRQLMLMSEAQEIQIGRETDAEIRKQMGVYQDQQIQQYVSRVGQRLARTAHRPNLPWTFTVVDEPAVNAFALPGGFVYLTRGILPFLRDEAELAAVLGHEVGHVDARHSAEQYSKQQLAGGGLLVASVLAPEYGNLIGAGGGLAAQMVLLKYGRDAELESDQLGVRYSAANGWEPRAMQGLLGTLARLDEAQGSRRGVPNWALTHPPAADRVTKIQEAVTTTRVAGTPATNRAEFERVLDGVVFGDSREKGIVRGSEFVHPVLRFSLRFPNGWEIANTNEQVAAIEREGGRVAMVLELAPNGGSVEQTARTTMTKAGLREANGERTRINGLDAYVGTYEGVSGSTRIGVRAAHIRSGQQTYLIAGLAPVSDFSRVARQFDASLQSFRPMSADEAARIQPNRVDFYTVRSGETWDSIAQRAGGAIKPSTLAIMNGQEPGAPPRAGTRIRIVTGG